MLSFLLVILAGGLLLSLPVSTQSGEAVSFTDALFTATTATCVTGLVTLPTVSTWSIFGQAVILLLIQIGGLGLITVISGFMISMHKRFGISGKMLVQDSFNLNTLSGLSDFVRRAIKGTLIVECVGALAYMTVFVPEFGARGIWISVFNSVSAFCNAGIDIIAEDSLCGYVTNPVINLVTCLLIILGGLGYVVWWDVIRVSTAVKKKGIKALRELTLHSKIALSFTALLIGAGAVGIFIFEYSNPLTVKDCSIYEKIQFAFFQSVTTRTAGFATVPQENLTNASAVLSLLLMFIGGSPVGTAGGVKTVTVAVLIAAAASAIKGREQVNIFSRSINPASVRKAMGVTAMSFTILFASTVLLSAVTPDAHFADVIYETVSATATVGLTRGFTSSLDLWGKLIIIVTMYLGRVGPISLALAFRFRKINRNAVKNPTEEISVG